MPEYLTPGVYIEETSFRSKSIQGVGTSTAGFIGPTLTGPLTGEPELLTSFADFVRIYGGLGDINFSDGVLSNYLAHGVRSFFQEGGSRCYVTRIFNSGDLGFVVDEADPDAADAGLARFYGQATNREDEADDADPLPFTIVARFPGNSGNMRIFFTLNVGANIAQLNSDNELSLTRTRNFDTVLARIATTAVDDTVTYSAYGGGTDGLYFATRNDVTGVWSLTDGATTEVLLAGEAAYDAVIADVTQAFDIRPVSVNVEIQFPDEEPNTFQARQFLGTFTLDARSGVALTNTFTPIPVTRYQELTSPFAIVEIDDGGDILDLDNPDDAAEAGLILARNLVDISGNALTDDASPSVDSEFLLAGGSDGAYPVATNYAGNEAGLVDFINDTLNADKNGFLALREKEDIAIVVATGYTTYGTGDDVEDDIFAIQNEIINHCERMVYRVAVLETPRNYLVSQAQNFRNRRSSHFAAMYYPWVRISDPRPSRGGASLLVPPSGHMAGIWARNDVENAVFKAPANEVVRTAIGFEVNVNRAQQAVLNPDGVNCLRFFEGRGNLVWGARTISDDSDWTYVNVRRYFAYLEASIDRGTQWAVFENNGPRLWDKVRTTIENFLFNEWRAGGLLGTKPESAYFVICDRSTMTQQDLDQGRLICLIGVAPIKPAEFVIFRIGQFTADSN